MLHSRDFLVGNFLAIWRWWCVIGYLSGSGKSNSWKCGISRPPPGVPSQSSVAATLGNPVFLVEPSGRLGDNVASNTSTVAPVVPLIPVEVREQFVPPTGPLS